MYVVACTYNIDMAGLQFFWGCPRTTWKLPGDHRLKSPGINNAYDYTASLKIIAVTAPSGDCPIAIARICCELIVISFSVGQKLKFFKK